MSHSSHKQDADSLCCAVTYHHHSLLPSQLFQRQPFLKFINPPSPSLETFIVRKVKPHTQSSKFWCWIYYLLPAKGDYFNSVSTQLTYKEAVILWNKKSKGRTTQRLVNSVAQQEYRKTDSSPLSALASST